MKRFIESIINDITMYRLVLYSLIFIATVAVVLGFGNVIDLSPESMIISLATLIITSYASSRLLAWTFSTRHNRESWLISALILFFILMPPKNVKDIIVLALVAFIMSASKYILVIAGRHIFNPAAIAVVIAGLLGFTHGAWWVGTPYLLPAVFIAGLLVVWKVRRFAMVGLFLLVATLTALSVGVLRGYDLSEVVSVYFLSGPLFFAAAIMLTEPLTAPTTRKWQLVYAALIGLFMTWKIAPFFTPEVAIVLGNIFAAIVVKRKGISLRFVSTTEIAPHTYEVVLKSEKPLHFIPGQFLELSLPHKHADSRGIRRTFSIASSPNDEYIRLGITTSNLGSTFKQELLKLKKDTELRVTQIGGDFVVPKSSEPLLFVAGGIGITPFRAVLDDLINREDHRDIVLLHALRSEDFFIYQETIQAAEKYGLIYIPVVTNATPEWKGQAGIINSQIIQENAPDFKNRRIYLSGPSLMVDSIRSQLLKSGVKCGHIVKDYFSGY
jgi:ferredoxin-NADP reductase/Na+-translocating ferredoxin:NAD+ oxidoreductase RnfD subunit